MNIEPPQDDLTLAAGAIYVCNSVGRCFMGLLWQSHSNQFYEYGLEFIRTLDAEIIFNKIRESGTVTRLDKNGSLYHNFVTMRAVSGTQLIWRHSNASENPGYRG